MILLVGTADKYLVDIAKSISSDAILITQDNCHLVKLGGVGYTGIEEFNDNLLFVNTLLRADQVQYHPSTKLIKFDISNPTTSARGLTEHYLLLINQSNPVKNIDLIMGSSEVNSHESEFLKLADIRKTTQPQIWGVGCSVTYGDGVKQSERYIDLISNKLNMPASCLAVNGGSIIWAADQILRSDIQNGDTIIWGLTTKERMPWYYNNKLWHINAMKYEHKEHKWVESYLPRKVLIDEHNSMYRSLTHIHQVINYCDKVGANLLLVGLLTSAADVLYLHNLPNFYQYYNNTFEFLDLGDDNVHPGPLQHQHYAQEIIKQLKIRNWI